MIDTAVREKGFWQGEIWNRRKSGELYPEWLSVSAVKDADNLIRLADAAMYRAKKKGGNRYAFSAGGRVP